MASVIDVQNHFQQYYQIYLGGQFILVKKKCTDLPRAYFSPLQL